MMSSFFLKKILLPKDVLFTLLVLNERNFSLYCKESMLVGLQHSSKLEIAPLSASFDQVAHLYLIGGGTTFGWFAHHVVGFGSF